MNFIEMLIALKEGKKVKCKYWYDPCYIKLDKNNSIVGPRGEPQTLHINRIRLDDSDVWELYEPILDDVEHQYLSNIIKPFRKRVSSIKKITNLRTMNFFINIELDGGYSTILLPEFSIKSEMYKNMEADRLYTLEELGL